MKEHEEQQQQQRICAGTNKEIFICPIIVFVMTIRCILFICTNGTIQSSKHSPNCNCPRYHGLRAVSTRCALVGREYNISVARLLLDDNNTIVIKRK